ncbi:MAG: TatD family hydrolase [Pseudomonadota bacterium]
MPAPDPTRSPTPLIDSHVNLHGEAYADDLDAVFERAEAANVAGMIAISDTLASTEAVTAVADRGAAVWRSAGVHPHYAQNYRDLSAETLIALAASEDVVGIGECGLDYYYEYSDRAVQAPVFEAHIAAARATGLPLIIHSRDADADMARYLAEHAADGAFRPLLHCYTGGWDLAETSLGLGGYVAFSGIVSFKKADEVRAVAARVPLDRLIVETDCPYLAPVPWRGRRNEPAYIGGVVEALAAARGEDVETVARATTANFFRLFERARPVPPAVLAAGLA